MAEPEDDRRPLPEGGEPEPKPVDEAEAWAQIVAGYDADPEPGTASWPEAEDVAEGSSKPGHLVVPSTPETTSIVIHPVISGPRDYELDEDDDEGHFVPPEPPPLPNADVTTKFAWLGALGGPLLIFAFILFQEEMPWWAVTVGIGGFLGGFATLVTRMRPGGDEDDDLPGGGAVV